MESRNTNELYVSWTNGPKYILAAPTSDPSVLAKATAIGSPSDLLVWIKLFPHRVGTFFVDAPENIVMEMRGLRPELTIRELPDKV